MAKFVASVAATPVVASGYKKASAFINIYITQGETRRKIGAIPLKDDNAYEVALMERLGSDPEAINKMAAVIQLDYRAVSDAPVDVKSLGF